MKKWKIITDSGSSIREIETTSNDIAFDSVPLMINIDDEVYVDNPDLDISHFLEVLNSTQSESSSACSSPEVYADHFTGAENVICFTISSELSGSYNSANLGKNEALENNPDINIYIHDSRSAGSEQDLLVLKAVELAEKGIEFDEMITQISDYHEKTDVAFLLESVDNLVKNGRVSKIVGQMVGLLGIRLVGNRTPQGTIQLAHKSKGRKRGLQTLYKELLSKGYKGGKIEVSHVLNRDLADSFKELILTNFPDADISIRITSALCSYYAEQNGMIVGFEIN